MASRMHELQRALESARVAAIEALSRQDSVTSPASDSTLRRLADIQLALTAVREEMASQVGRGGEAPPG
jgi:hypothetical protein